MSSELWFLFLGGLLLFMGLTSWTWRRLPVTTAIIYLIAGVTVGPTFLNLFHFNPLREAGLLEVLTEVAALISLFSAGVKMPVPVTYARWRAPLLLASASMFVTVMLVALFAYFVLGLPFGACILLGAIIAPTDPVLATDVQSRHPGDPDRLRFTLTCEAGMNDGTAFPFVVLGMGLLGLHEIGKFGSRWVLEDVIWATSGGVLLGVVLGSGLGYLGCFLRKKYQQGLLDDFLSLGLIGMVYGLSLYLHVWGFLAVFFAAVALRQTEFKLTCSGSQENGHSLHRSDSASNAALDAESLPLVSTGSLAFNEHLERLSEVVLMILIGGTLFINSWSWRATGLALFLFFVARPASVLAGLSATRMPLRIRGLAGWFGVRGIGSLYYLMYAIERGLPYDLALELIHLTLIVVTLSIILHGLTVKPLMSYFRRRPSS